MSTHQPDDGAKAPGLPRGGRGGRGGGRAPVARTARGAGTTPRVVTAKIGPNRLLETDWSKDAALKGSAFVLWLGAGNSGDQQMTFHRPIGETRLTQSQWVATPTRDISFLLQRRESEELASWKRKSEQAKRIAVLRAARGRKYQTNSDPLVEVWTFDGSPAIQPTIRTCMSAAKAAGAPDSAWLDYADTAVRVAEQQFKEALKNQGIPEGWLRLNPRPTYETMGGALGDIPQKAVGYLNGISASAAKDKVLKVAVGLEQTDPLPLPEEEEEEDEEEENPPPVQPAPEPKAPDARSASTHSRKKSEESTERSSRKTEKEARAASSSRKKSPSGGSSGSKK